MNEGNYKLCDGEIAVDAMEYYKSEFCKWGKFN